MLLGLMPSRRAADQLFPFVFLPQFFTAGVFVPINNLPLPLEIISLLSPLRYVVDLTAGCIISARRNTRRSVLDPIIFNVTVLRRLVSCLYDYWHGVVCAGGAEPVIGMRRQP